MLFYIGTHHNFHQSLPFSDLIGTKHNLKRVCLYIFANFSLVCKNLEQQCPFYEFNLLSEDPNIRILKIL